MATAYIEYCALSDQEGAKISGICHYAATATIAGTASTATSAVTSAQYSIGVRILRIQNDGTPCYVAIGTTPDPTSTVRTEATSIRRYLAGGAIDYFPLKVGDKVSVIAVS